MLHSTHRSSPKKNARNKNTETPPLIGVCVASAKACLLSLAAAAVLALVFCIIAVNTEDPLSVICYLSPVALYVSAFLAGFFTLRASEKDTSELLCGIASGGMLTLICKLLAFFLPASPGSLTKSFVLPILHIAVFLFSTIGSYTAARMIKSKKQKRRSGRRK